MPRFPSRRAARTAARLALSLGVASTALTFAHLFGGLEPLGLHALALGAAAWPAALVAERRRGLRGILAACAAEGALLWTVSTLVTLAAHHQLGAPGVSFLLFWSVLMGASCGLVCAPLVDGIAGLRASRALDAPQSLLTQAAAWLVVVATCSAVGLVVLGASTAALLPIAAIALGLTTLAAVVAVDAAQLAWIRAVAERPRGAWSVVEGERVPELPPPVWSGQEYGDRVLVRQPEGPHQPYRAPAPVPVAVLAADPLPGAVALRRRTALAVACLALGLGAAALVPARPTRARRTTAPPPVAIEPIRGECYYVLPEPPSAGRR